MVQGIGVISSFRVYIFMYRCLYKNVFISLRYIPRSEVAHSCYISVYKILPVSQNGGTILQFHKQCMRGPVALPSHEHMVMPVFCYFSHSIRSVAISHWGFNLHIPVVQWWWTSWRLPICHAYLWWSVYSRTLPVFKLDCLGSYCSV